MPTSDNGGQVWCTWGFYGDKDEIYAPFARRARRFCELDASDVTLSVVRVVLTHGNY